MLPCANSRVPAHVHCSGIDLLQAERRSKPIKTNALHSPPRRGGAARSAGVVSSARCFGRADHPVLTLLLIPKLDGLPMWCTPIGLRPGLFALGERLSIGQAFRLNKMFESSQPMLVIMRAIVGFTAIGRRFEFISQGCGPFFPGEVSLFGELYCEGECLSLPGFRKDGPFGITRQ